MYQKLDVFGGFLCKNLQKSHGFSQVKFTKVSDHQESREPTFRGLGLVQKHPKPEEKNHRDLFATFKWDILLIHWRVSCIAPVQLIVEYCSVQRSKFQLECASAKPGKWSCQCVQRLIPPYTYVYIYIYIVHMAYNTYIYMLCIGLKYGYYYNLKSKSLISQ